MSKLNVKLMDQYIDHVAHTRRDSRFYPYRDADEWSVSVVHPFNETSAAAFVGSIDGKSVRLDRAELCYLREVYAVHVVFNDNCGLNVHYFGNGSIDREHFDKITQWENTEVIPYNVARWKARGYILKPGDLAKLFT